MTVLLSIMMLLTLLAFGIGVGIAAIMLVNLVFSRLDKRKNG